jgi:PAS domain S-box-containing protein
MSARDAIVQVMTARSGLTWEEDGYSAEPKLSIAEGTERSGCVLVVDEHQSLGIVMERDLLAAALHPDALDTITLRSLMSPAPLTWCKATINNREDLHTIWRQMQHQKVTIVPVLDDCDQPIGIISARSLFYAFQADESAVERDIAPQESRSVESNAAINLANLANLTDPLDPLDPTDLTNPPDSAAIATPEIITTWREQSARYRSLFEDAYDAILIANPDGYITDVNSQAEVLFGYSRHELIGLHQSALHPPEDFDDILASFQEFAQATINTAKNIRILCNNQQIKYVDIRGKIIMVGAQPIIQGIFREVTQQNRIEETLRIVTKQTEDKQGTDFFVALVQAIAQTLNVDYVFLAELIDEHLITLAIYPQEDPKSNVVYSPGNTPCEQVLKRGNFVCQSGLQQHFPQELPLIKMAAEGYVGTVLLDQKGEVIGNLFVVTKKPINNIQYILAILKVFATRAAAELERQRANQKLEILNQDLQKTLVKRTYELRKQEHFLHTLLNLDAFPLSVFWKDLNSVYLGCNQSFLRDAQLQSFEEIIGKDDYEMPWGATEADKYRADDREVMASNQPKLGIIETQAQGNGHQLWLETNKMPFYDLDGNVMGVLGLYQNITDRKQAEHELQQVSARLNLAVKSAKIGIWEWKISTNTLIWDEQMFALYGIKKSEDMMQHHAYEIWLSCLHPEDSERVNHVTQEALSGSIDYDVEFRIVRPDGEVRFLHANAIVQRDDNGQPLVMIGVNYDITDLKRTEQQLQQKLETINAAVEGIAIFQGERFISINPAHVKLFGYEQADELIGQSWKILYEPDELVRFDRDILPTLMRDRAWQGEAIARRKDGSTFLQGLSLTLSEENLLICMCRDITARKQAEQQLREAKEAAELANRAKSNFLALMSHEIRTPINGVLGLAHLMQQTQLDPPQQEYLTNLHYSAQSLSQIVNDILDFSKIEADKLSLDQIKFELGEVLDRLKAVLALKASEKHLDLQFEIGETVPRYLIGDPLRLGQVAINLVSNAIKFTDHGSVTLCIEERDRHETTTRLRFTVRDTGIGLMPDQLNILFEPFTQIDSSASRRQSGTGLGLTICQRLVKLMGGTIEVQSEPGCGSTFCFELTLEYDTSRDPAQDGLDLNLVQDCRDHADPTCAANVPELTTEKQWSSTSSTTSLNPTIDSPMHSILQNASVLLVEDNDVNQLVARKILEQFGLNVDRAVNGRQAIAKVLNHRYDLILMDIRMPEMDGLEATRRIRRLSQLDNTQTRYLKDVPIIAMTAHAFKSDRQRSLQAGMNDHLSKPIDPESLYRTLADWLVRGNSVLQSAWSSPKPLASLKAVPTSIARPDEGSIPVSEAVLSQPLIQLPELDVAEGLARVYNDPQLYRDLLDLFTEIYQPFASDLRNAFEQDNAGHVLHLIHTLKGAAANVSASILVQQSEQILQTLRTQTDDSPNLQFESDEIVELLRSLDVTLATIAHVTDVIAQSP